MMVTPAKGLATCVHGRIVRVPKAPKVKRKAKRMKACAADGAELGAMAEDGGFVDNEHRQRMRKEGKLRVCIDPETGRAKYVPKGSRG